MFNKYIADKNEEEKVDNYSKKNRTRNIDIFNNFKSSKNKEINVNSPIKNQNITEIKNNNLDKSKNQILNTNSNNVLKNDNDKNIQMKKTKKSINNIKEINLNKDELYNAFIIFQQLLFNNEDENINEENIKDKLFNFVIEKKNNFKNKKRNKFNKVDSEKNNNIFFTDKNLHIFSKTFFDNNIIHNNNEIRDKNNSFSYRNYWKNKKFFNLFNLIDENIKESSKSVSQIIDEYLIKENKNKDRTNSQNNSRYSNHGYSFDAKNNEKNDISFQSILEKEKINDKFFDFNHNLFNANYNSDKKEIGNKKYFVNNSEKKIKNNFNKINFTENSLIELKFKKNEKLDSMNTNSKEGKYKNENFSNILYNNCLLNTKITISPSKNKEESYIQAQNFKKKTKESFIEPEKTNINEIKVNKSKVLYHKENLINEKIKELEEEIKFFHEERQKILKIKDEYEKLKIKLLKDKKELNLKKQIQQKYSGNDFERLKLVPKTGTNFIMNITQHNHSLILNNYKKTETINLLKKRIYQLENIIKNKNKNKQENRKIHNNIIKSIRENNIYLFTKKKNDYDKKINDDLLIKRKKVNLKMNIESNSLEKLNKMNKKNNPIQQNQNINKKIKNASYKEQKIKNNLSTTKTLNIHNFLNNTKRIIENNSNGYHLKTIASFSNKYNHKNAKIKKNNSLINKDAKIEHSKPYIYEKLLKKESEKEKEKEKENKNNKFKYNINSVRNFGECKKIMKKMNTEIGTNHQKLRERYKKSIINNNNFNESKNILISCQKSQGKNSVSKKLEIKNEDKKNKVNSIILEFKKDKLKNNNDNNIISRENINNEEKENNSLNSQTINIVNNKNKINDNFEDDNNIEGYDFVIPEKYKSKNDGKIINSIKSDGKIINIYNDNKKEIIFQSGVRKEVFSDGYQLINFPNGDIKQKFPGKEGKIMYFYKETNTVETTFKNGLNIFKFNNGQIEKHYPDGSKYIIYSNGLRRKISNNGTEEIFNSKELDKSEEKIDKNILLETTKINT